MPTSRAEKQVGSRTGRLLALLLAIVVGGCTQPAPKIEPAPLSTIKPSGQSVAKLNSLWSAAVGDEDKRGSTRFVPYVDDTGVYAASIDGGVVRLGIKNGKRAWRRNLDVRLSSGVGGDSKHVYVSSRDGEVFALDKQTGDTVWTQRMSSEVLVRPATGQTSQALISGNAAEGGFDELVIVRASNSSISALDINDGEVLWTARFETPALTLHGYSEPLVLRSGILAGLEDGKLVALSRDAGQLLWESTVSHPSGRSEVERLVDIDANLLIDEAHIYAVTYQGNLVQIEPQRGQVQWSRPLSSVAGMAQDSEHLYVTLEDSELVAITKSAGDIVWRQDAMRGRSLSRPTVVAGERIIVADFEGYVHTLDSSSGELVGRKRSGSTAASNPLVSDQLVADQTTAQGTIFMQNLESRVYALTVR